MLFSVLVLFFATGKPMLVQLFDQEGKFELAELFELDDLEEDDLEDSEKENKEDTEKEDKIFETFDRLEVAEYSNKQLASFYKMNLSECQQEVMVPPPDRV